MAHHKRTQQLIRAAWMALRSEHPMTVRQLFYRLVSEARLENNPAAYGRVIRALRDARLEGAIPWEYIEDRLRRPRRVSMWADLADFADTACRAYRRDVWAAQPGLVEVWLEKDALSGIFEAALEPYGVTLNVGRGYDGWSSIHAAAQRYGCAGDGRPPVTVLYFGDHDPSGEDMQTSLTKRLRHFGCRPEIVRVAILSQDIERYSLPPIPAKRSDRRAAAFIARHGDECVELDALPVSALRQRIRTEIEARLDLEMLHRVRQQEADDRARLSAALEGCDA